MNNDEGVEFVKCVLDLMGYQATVIPECSEKTPDLEVQFSLGKLIVEVKSKEDDQQLRDLVDSEPETVLFYKDSSIYSLLRRAWSQLQSYQSTCGDSYTAIWMLACKSQVTFLTRPVLMQLLYGIENLTGFMEETHKRYDKQCFFFRDSFFFRRKGLNAVLIQDFNEITLCLNPYGDNYEAFASSDFAQTFRQRNLLIDPKQLEETGTYIVADCEFPRNETGKIVEYLRDKYGLGRPTITNFCLVNCPV